MKWVVCLLGCFICGVTLAEMRLWEDKKGNSLEAEYKCEVSGKVVLRDRKGKDHTLSISSLSEKDQQYLQSKLPPKIEIKFKKLQDRRRINEAWATVTMYGEIVLTKTSRMPYNGDLKATLLMIGEDSFEDEYVLLDKKASKFSFRTAKTHSFSGERFKMQEYRYSSNGNDGVEYKGYLVVVHDASGKILTIKASSDELEGKADYLLKIECGARFPDKMRGKASRGSSLRNYR